MCGIVGFFNFNNSVELVRNGLDVMKHRGIDGFKLFDGKTLGENIKSSSGNCLGHRRYDINGFNPMPLIKDNLILSADGEIYNFKELAKNLNLNPDYYSSYSGVLLEFFSKNSLNKNSLSLLDGVYAISLWDLNDNKIIITRDLLG